MINEYPSDKCYTCGKDNWWYRQTGGREWVCAICHPPPDPIEALKARVIRGNHKMNVAFEKIARMVDGPEREASLQAFSGAVTVLKGLCNDLKLKRATECLYIEDGKKMRKCLKSGRQFHCSVCPNDYWWEKELLELGKKESGE